MLVAGLGNVFFGDDGFGVEVARRLASSPLPAAARVGVFGVRGLELAHALREPVQLLLALHIAPRGGTPGTLYVIDELEDGRDSSGGSIDLPLALAAARAARGSVPRVRVIGCEPADLRARSGLSAPVQQAIDPAVELVRRLVRRELATR